MVHFYPDRAVTIKMYQKHIFFLNGIFFQFSFKGSRSIVFSLKKHVWGLYYIFKGRFNILYIADLVHNKIINIMPWYAKYIIDKELYLPKPIYFYLMNLSIPKIRVKIKKSILGTFLSWPRGQDKKQQKPIFFLNGIFFPFSFKGSRSIVFGLKNMSEVYTIFLRGVFIFYILQT